MGDDTTLAVSYYTYGRFVYNSAKILSDHSEFDKKSYGDIFSLMPFYFLVSHAAELFLKAALLKRGFGEANLRKFDYRHNLEELLAQLESKGVPVTEGTRTMVKKLGLQHRTHELRFPDLVKGINVYMPEPTSAFEMLDELFLLTRISTHGV